MAGKHSATGMSSAPTLVVGLGNPLLGDDGLGWRVAEQVQHKIGRANGDVEVDYLAVGGLRLMERLVGYQRAVLIDAITTGQQPVGRLFRLTLEDLPDKSGGHFSSAHDTSLQTALSTGRSLGLPLPETIIIFGIEAEQIFDFSEELSPAVAAAVPNLAKQIIAFLNRSFRKENNDDFA
jgi:hydrogenase maturation protease